jgi:hypothetical protein
MSRNRLLRERVAAQSAMARVVAASAAAPARTPIAALLGLSPLRPQCRADYRAALAELRVGDVLENLGQRWDVLHDLPLRDGSLDHLVIGPAGVFAVRTVHCGGLEAVVDPGGLAIGARVHDDLALARADADEVSDILGDASGERIRVRPLLVLVDARRLTVRAPVPAVRIVTVQNLERTLGRAPRTLTGDEVAAVSDLADQGATWPRADAAALDTQALHRDFAGIRSLVRSALRRRVLWILGGFAAVYAVVWALVGALVTLLVS